MTDAGRPFDPIAAHGGTAPARAVVAAKGITVARQCASLASLAAGAGAAGGAKVGGVAQGTAHAARRLPLACDLHGHKTEFVLGDSPRSAAGTASSGDVRDAPFGSQVTTLHDDGPIHQPPALTGRPVRRQPETHADG